MPEIARFYGIVIKMFFKPKEHEPSHIHALYGEHIGIFNIETLKMTEWDLPTKAQELVTEWLKKNQKELLDMWETQKISKLPPLWGGFEMIIRIKEVKPLCDFRLSVLFDDGKSVIYDVKDDISTLPGYDDLKNISGLFESVQLDESRTCVFWNDYIDLPSDAIYEYGVSVWLSLLKP